MRWFENILNEPQPLGMCTFGISITRSGIKINIRLIDTNTCGSLMGFVFVFVEN